MNSNELISFHLFALSLNLYAEPPKSFTIVDDNKQPVETGGQITVIDGRVRKQTSISVPPFKKKLLNLAYTSPFMLHSDTYHYTEEVDFFPRCVLARFMCLAEPKIFLW